MIKKAISEFIGTFFLIFFGCASIILNRITNTGVVFVGLSFGITLIVMINLFGKISGAHFNPIISFTFFIMNQIKFIEFVLYTIFQILGGIISCFFLVLIFGRNFFHTELMVENIITSNTDLTPIGIIVVLEFIFSFIIMFLYTKVTINGKIKDKFAPFFIGFIYFVSSIFLINIDRIGLNIIRILIPSLYNFKFDYVLYYLAGNGIGTFLGGISYHFFNKANR